MFVAECWLPFNTADPFFIFIFIFLLCALGLRSSCGTTHSLSPTTHPSLVWCGEQCDCRRGSKQSKTRTISGNNQNAKFRQSLSEKKKFFECLQKFFYKTKTSIIYSITLPTILRILDWGLLLLLKIYY